MGASKLPREAPNELRGSPWLFMRQSPQESTLSGQQEDTESAQRGDTNVNAATQAIWTAILSAVRVAKISVCVVNGLPTLLPPPLHPPDLMRTGNGWAEDRSWTPDCHATDQVLACTLRQQVFKVHGCNRNSAMMCQIQILSRASFANDARIRDDARI